MGAISSSPHTILDLTECTFIDSSGIGVIVRAQRALLTRIGPDPTLLVVAVAPQVQKVLELTGVNQVVRIYDDLPTAMIAAPDYAPRPIRSTISS